MNSKISYLLFVFLMLVLCCPQLISAQIVNQGVAEYQKINGDVKDGNIVVFENGTYLLSHSEYSPDVYGVVTSVPAIAISQVGHEGAYPVVTSGKATVLVNNSNGQIQPGDYVTSSSVPGVAMKATSAGFVLGVADSPSGNNDSDNTMVSVTINPMFISSIANEPLSAKSFMAQFNNVVSVGMRAAASEPNTALRYGAAVMVLVLSMLFGFMIFGRAAANGVTAVGRNPLAKASIIAVVSFNILITIAFALVGLVLAFLILAL